MVTNDRSSLSCINTFLCANFESSRVRLELEAPPDLSLAPTPDPDEDGSADLIDRVKMNYPYTIRDNPSPC